MSTASVNPTHCGVPRGAEAPLLHRIRGLTAEQIGTIAWKSHLPLFELTAQQASLEEAFIEMTHESVEYRSTDTAAVSA